MNFRVGLGFIFLFTASVAFADGFICQSSSLKLKAKVENFRNASDGTRNVQFFSLQSTSNPDDQITFDTKMGSVRNRSTYYFAKVDLRFSEVRQSRIKLFSKPLEEFEEIYLDVKFSYGSPVPGGSKVPAEFLALHRESRDLLRGSMTCVRQVDSY